MAITIVIEEANFASGARLAGLVAQSLEKLEPVRLLLRDAGPLEAWLAEHVRARIDLCNPGNFPYGLSFAERVSAAGALLQSDASDTFYVYGLGASDFATAARVQGRRVVMHAYETVAQIEYLLARDQAKTDCAAFCDALVISGSYNNETISRLFGGVAGRVVNVGLRVDFEWLTSISAGPLPEAVNAAGEHLDWSRSFVVGSRGSTERGREFFVSLVRECPGLAFAWLGGDGSRENCADSEVLAAALSNLYAAVNSRNDPSTLAGLGAYVLCGREAQATMPLAAAAMGIPVIGFSGNGMTELLGRYGILCHGNPNVSLVAGILGKIAAESLPPVHDVNQRREQLDVSGCVDKVLQCLADVRLIGDRADGWVH